ncbi:MAG: alpha-galactosidase [Chloroflexi bacterium]|nr:alpha-galactosidase [Chloroflexota bacterium]MCL5273129.1 alpha-galactosidase [Chloroflexota bacterium]
MKIKNQLPTTTPEDMTMSRAWAARMFADASTLPISFVLSRQAVRGIPAAWQPAMRTRRIDANIFETVFEGADAATGLRVTVECTEYRDYPVMEWVAWFTNTGREPTPIISHICSLDATFKGASPVLYHCNGDYYSVDGYRPQETPIAMGQTFAYAPNGGRPCDGAFPYYRVAFADWGLSLAIGWPAQWAADFNGLTDGVLIRAGQERTNLRLKPGESIRTPRMTVLSWAGDGSRAVNLWRRWYLAHILPRPNGQPMKPLLACAATDEGEEFTAATEQNQIDYIDKFNSKGIHPDVWWIDAGWYPCYNKDHERRWWITGDWKPDPERFPVGMQPVSERAARDGADLLVWFEPERVQPGTALDTEHPEWLLKMPDDDNGLLYLGNPECRRWLTDHVCKLIQDNGIKIYRQDHNFPPLQHWRRNEADDRQGMNENLHVQGYLQFWDDLLARNPGLWIDSCASGGRRNDLETMRRSVPLHYTDFGYGDHPVKLAFHRTMYEWIPYFKESTLSWDQAGAGRFDSQVDSYSFHCGMAAMLFATVDIRRDDYDFALAARMIDVWRRASNLLLYGDYYPHTPYHKRADQWVAWQFDHPEAGEGFVQGIRLPASPDATLAIHLKGIQPDAAYLFTNAETGERHEIAGDVLMRDGFTLALPPRNGVIWFYRAM